MKALKITSLLPLAVILLGLSLGVSNCKKTGGGITDPGDPDLPQNEPQQISSNFVSEDSGFLPGEFQFITINGTELSDSEYDAALNDGTPVTLYRYSEDSKNKTLLFIIPEASEGSKVLNFNLNDQKHQLEFEINPYQTIENPRAYATSFADSLISVLDGMIDRTTHPGFKNQLIVDRDSLINKKDEFANLDEEKTALLARLIKTNFEQAENEAKIKRSVNHINLSSVTCQNTNFENIKLYLVKASASGFVTGLGVALGVMAPGVGTIIGGGIAIIGGAVTYKYIQKLADELPDIEICASNWFDETSSEFIESTFKNNSSENVFHFEHGNTSSFKLQVNYEAPGDFIQQLEKFKRSIESIADKLPQNWIDIFNDDYSSFEQETSTESLELVSVSDERVNFTSESDSTNIHITLEYKKVVLLDMGEKAINMELTKAVDSNTYTLEAIITPPIPVAYDMHVKTDLKETITDTMKASYAAKFTIEESEDNGTLTLIDEKTGIFEFKPSEEFTEGVTFTFNAINSKGTSNSATISLGTKLIYTDPRDGTLYAYTKLIGLDWFLEDLSYNRSSVNNYRFSESSDICPPGWRVPSKDDFIALFNSLDLTRDEDGAYVHGSIFMQALQVNELPAGDAGGGYSGPWWTRTAATGVVGWLLTSSSTQDEQYPFYYVTSVMGRMIILATMDILSQNLNTVVRYR